MFNNCFIKGLSALRAHDFIILENKFRVGGIFRVSFKYSTKDKA